jgi:hypothetical protein
MEKEVVKVLYVADPELKKKLLFSTLVHGCFRDKMVVVWELDRMLGEKHDQKIIDSLKQQSENEERKVVRDLIEEVLSVHEKNALQAAKAA